MQSKVTQFNFEVWILNFNKNLWKEWCKQCLNFLDVRSAQKGKEARKYLENALWS